MSRAAKHIQPSYNDVTPYFSAKLDLLDFLRRALGAEVTQQPTPDESGRFHAEVRIGDANLLLGSGYFADPSMSAAVYIYVPDVDATYKHAVSLGATALREPADQHWGDRVAGVKDSSGNTWWIATHKGEH
jgi:PhnB protein